MFANNRLSLSLVDSPATDLLLLITEIIHEALHDSLKAPQFGPSNKPSKSASCISTRTKVSTAPFAAISERM